MIAKGLDIGFRVLGVLVVWFVGSWLIRLIRKMVRRGLTTRNVDETLVKYTTSALDILLKIILVVAIFSYFGVETTTIAGLLAGVGLAIGTMWGGMMANLAAGGFMIFFKPFKVGDFVNVGDVVGTVKEIGIFNTTINTPDNILTYVSNNKIFTNNIQNFSANTYRRVDLQAQLNNTANPIQAIRLLEERLARIPNVLTEPAPDVEILGFNRPVPFWECALMSTKKIIGKFILIPTGSSMRPLQKPGSWRRNDDSRKTIQRVTTEGPQGDGCDRHPQSGGNYISTQRNFRHGNISGDGRICRDPRSKDGSRSGKTGGI